MFENLQKLENNYLEKGGTVKITHYNGTKVEISGNTASKYRVEFICEDKVEYETTIGTGYFASPNKKYFVPWKINVYSEDNEIVVQHVQSLKGKKVYVYIDSSSLGDTLAWVPQAIHFSKVHECKLILCTFFNELFDKSDPDITWIGPGQYIGEHDASYVLGYFLGEDRFSYTPVDPRTSPLGKVAADILGIPYEERIPKMATFVNHRPVSEKYVCIATRSTAGAKLWHRENGWQDIVDYLRLVGYSVLLIQKESDHQLKNVIDCTGDIPLVMRMNQIKNAELFIGIGSGLSWLAWALEKPVIMISGFSEKYAEFQNNCHRVTNESVCHGCWNNTSHMFDKGDWNWCPEHKGTERQFECSYSISCVQVIEAINLFLPVSI